MHGGEIDWSRVRRVLVVRLRSIGDTVLATPALLELKRFLPSAQVDILLEHWVAPLLKGSAAADNVLVVGDSLGSRFSIAREIYRRKYDVVFNLHGGTTATFFTFLSGAHYRVGYSHYRYAFLHNIVIGSAVDFWNRRDLHSVEQQLALLGAVGVPVSQRSRPELTVTPAAITSLKEKLARESTSPELEIPFALVHPAAAFATKQWSAENFARTAEFLAKKGLQVIAVASKDEREILEQLHDACRAPVVTFDDLTLPEITALASRASIFVGNDSGIAHVAAAVRTPSVVVFGSSNRVHWRPWTDAANEIVFSEFACQPCAGHECREFGEPRCILSVKPEQVFQAIEKVMR